MDPPSPSHIITTPADGIASVTVAGGMSPGNVNFGVYIDESEDTDFHNDANPLNVDNDPQNSVSAIDAVMVINWLNANPGTSDLPFGSSPRLIGYIDVNNDGSCSAIDAVEVINHLNAIAASPGGGGEGEVTSLTAASSSPESETASSLAAVQAAAESVQGRRTTSGPLRTAAAYYAQNPLHFDEIPGSELPCSCSQCLGTAQINSSTPEQRSEMGDSLAGDVSQTADGTRLKALRRLLASSY
jgi:hypothetical protein